MFAPAERAGAAELHAAFAELKSRLPYDSVLDLVPDLSFVVDGRRQILFANSAALEALGVDQSQILGSRPGEALDCVHSRETVPGCGGAEACRVCGADRAILDALEGGRRCSAECRISSRKDGRLTALDLRVTAVPLETKGGRFAVVTLSDIGDSKRRQSLERLFFHDLMNSIASLQGCVGLLAAERGGEQVRSGYLARLEQALKRLIDEVSQQRDLVTMETGELRTDPCEVEPEELARGILQDIELADYAEGKLLTLKPEGELRPLVTDPVLLGRVLVNMLKNALEASLPGEEVSLKVRREPGAAWFVVHNPAFIPRDIQLQIFQRSFSTKGHGRGLGTYSMKMLTEDYLGGRIGFESGEDRGTIFWVELLSP